MIAVMVISSCSSSRSLIPQAKNMVNTVYFDELNLTSKDYEILDRIEASSRIVVEMDNKSFNITDPDGTFKMAFVLDKKTGKMVLSNMEGVVRAGYLSTREMGTLNLDSPDEIAHRMAIYRLVNLVKEQGGDGILEPVISTNVEGVEQGGLFSSKITVTYFTTVSGKVIRVKTK